MGGWDHHKAGSETIPSAYAGLPAECEDILRISSFRGVVGGERKERRRGKEGITGVRGGRGVLERGARAGSPPCRKTSLSLLRSFFSSPRLPIFEEKKCALPHKHFRWWPPLHFFHHLISVISWGHESLVQVWEVCHNDCPPKVWERERELVGGRLEHINIVVCFHEQYRSAFHRF